MSPLRETNAGAPMTGPAVLERAHFQEEIEKSMRPMARDRGCPRVLHRPLRAAGALRYGRCGKSCSPRARQVGKARQGERCEAGLRRRRVGRKARRPEPPCLRLRTVRSGASPALACSFHATLRLTRCTHGIRHLANLFTTCRRICLRIQRKSLRIQRRARRTRLDGAF